MPAPLAATVTHAAILSERLGRTGRRLRQVEREPGLARSEDIELLLRAQGVPEVQVWAVSDRMSAADLDPALVWAWVMAFDGNELAALCGSELSDVYVAEHIHERSVPALTVTRSLLSS